MVSRFLFDSLFLSQINLSVYSMQIKKINLKKLIIFSFLYSFVFYVEAAPPSPETYRQKAEKGNANAQYQLGLAYFKGEGAAQDVPQAHWFNKAATRDI